MKQIICILLTLLLTNCKADDSNTPDCSAVLCAAFNLNIKIINTETNSNYVIDNDLDKSDIEIKNNENEPINFNLVALPTSTFNGSIIFFATASNYPTISIKNLDDIVVSYTIIQPQTNECCDFGTIENLVVDDYQFEFNSETNRLIVYL